jgi:hypothetical protein
MGKVFILDHNLPSHMITPAEETPQPTLSIKETSIQPSIDHNYIACLEFRFKGTWQSDSTEHYTAVGEDSELRVVRLDGVKKYLAFKTGAHVSMIFPNVVSYEQGDVEEDIDIEDQSS